eukprot:CAMPEP_0173189638 /NCGR_PEP_ID=MMETSP1141-20130122/11908_1 /TAXON_ID=483371 /ORGANISM="non described non described, Strain CCMP2298" /LENGTH=51 /DNA_ID=CAMNT_0014113673 /DNA_START=194 /DNA_END=349 /DNA_ORIENTATION=+
MREKRKPHSMVGPKANLLGSTSNFSTTKSSFETIVGNSFSMSVAESVATSA